MSNGWYTAGHCQDIDGFLVHEPGQCPGAVVNCSGKCCGPDVAQAWIDAASKPRGGLSGGSCRREP